MQSSIRMERTLSLRLPAISRALFSTQVASRSQEFNLAQYARGTGGRSSVSGDVVTIFGGNGRLGRILANRFGQEGAQIIVPYRSGDHWDLRDIKLCGDLGQVIFQPFSIRDPDSIRKAVQHSNVVINCIGTEYETRNFSYKDVHVDAARLIARISQECQVSKLIHMSSLNASLTPPKIVFKESEFLKTKFLGELAVKEEFPEAVIVRPAVMYGENDRFLFYYALSNRTGFKTISLWKKGEMTIKMPVHQMNVADGIMKIVHNKDIRAVTYDFVGPETFLLSDIIDFIYAIVKRDLTRTILSPTKLALTYLSERYLKRPNLTFDCLEREFISDSLSTDSQNPTLKDLNVNFKRFEDRAKWHLSIYDRENERTVKLKDYVAPEPPKNMSADFEFQLRRKLENF